MKKHKRLLVFQCKYTKTPMSKFECFGHAVKGQIYRVANSCSKNKNKQTRVNKKTQNKKKTI